jgi:hypothetical protein
LLAFGSKIIVICRKKNSTYRGLKLRIGRGEKKKNFNMVYHGGYKTALTLNHWYVGFGFAVAIHSNLAASPTDILCPVGGLVIFGGTVKI